jgi:hypothetical protein
MVEPDHLVSVRVQQARAAVLGDDHDQVGNGEQQQCDGQCVRGEASAGPHAWNAVPLDEKTRAATTAGRSL